jgi:hypothetical protein
MLPEVEKLIEIVPTVALVDEVHVGRQAADLHRRAE